MILLRAGGQQIRQDGQRHILKRDGGAVEKFQKIHAVLFDKLRDPRRVKLLIVSAVDTVL